MQYTVSDIVENRVVDNLFLQKDPQKLYEIRNLSQK